MRTATAHGLEARLRALIDERSMLKHPFSVALAAGSLGRGPLREYARQYYHFEAAFPQLLSSIHARTGSPRIRQLLLENLWDEEHGERNHPALWLQFASAVGVQPHAVTNGPRRPETTALIEHFSEHARNAPLAEALATLFAFEGQVPTLAWATIKALTDHYGLRPEQFEFFSVHLVADVSHSGAEIEAITLVCEDEEKVVAAAAEACDRLLTFLDGCMGTTGST